MPINFTPDDGWDAIEPGPDELLYVPTRFKVCPKCNQEVPVLLKCRCIGPEVKSLICVCGHRQIEHSYDTGKLTKSVINVCGRCLGNPVNNKVNKGSICTLFMEDVNAQIISESVKVSTPSEFDNKLLMDALKKKEDEKKMLLEVQELAKKRLSGEVPISSEAKEILKKLDADLVRINKDKKSS